MRKPVVAVVIHRDDKSGLLASETFLHAHITGLPCKVIPVLGNQVFRRVGLVETRWLTLKRLWVRLARLIERRLGLSTLVAQDTRALCRLFKRYGVEAVLAEYGPTAVLVMPACNKLGIPLIAHFHGYDAYRESVLEEYQDGYRQLFQQAAAIVVVSCHMRQQLLTLGAKPERLVYNSCGADISKGTVAAPAAALPLFLMVGRLVDKKDPLSSIRAFATVALRYPDARLEVIGDGPLRMKCEALCVELGVAMQVDFRGAQPHAEVLQAMTRARCFLQHSVRAVDGDMEGTPVGVLEAMGMGLPVIATRHGGIMDAVSDGETGLLVDEHDIAGMAEAIELMLIRPDIAGELGRKARLQVTSKWTMDQSMQRLWCIIEDALDSTMEEDIKRWTAKRKSALVLDIVQGKTTISEASRQYDLTPADIEGWVEQGKAVQEQAPSKS